MKLHNNKKLYIRNCFEDNYKLTVVRIKTNYNYVVKPSLAEKSLHSPTMLWLGLWHGIVFHWNLIVITWRIFYSICLDFTMEIITFKVIGQLILSSNFY